MEILKIVEVLQGYSEDTVAYKLDSRFAFAVTEAVRLLVEQGEQIADLENKLAAAYGGWIPVALGFLPEEHGRYLCNVKSFAFPGCYYQQIMNYDKYGFRDGCVYSEDVTHWMPLPEPPKEENNDC